MPARRPRFTLYRGPSLFDGAPIRVLLTLASSNRKIGDMAQVWILRDRVDPVRAVRTGADRSICGECPLRGTATTDRSCYVIPFQAPRAVWKASQEGLYPPVALADLPGVLAGRLVRVSAYGDPGAVPTAVWRTVFAAARGWTGYTHAWRRCDPILKSWLMASVESVADAAEARARGWRVFYARPAGVPAPTWAIPCPASHEAAAAGRPYTTCASCRLCNGQARPTARDVTIAAHGSNASAVGRQRLGGPAARRDTADHASADQSRHHRGGDPHTARADRLARY